MPHEHSAYPEKIRSSQWRTSFLQKLSSLQGFDTLLELAIKDDGWVAVHASRLTALSAGAQAIIRSYDKAELVAARQYYNNEHLLEFWRYYNQELGRLLLRPDVPEDFPLLEIGIDLNTLTYAIKVVPVQFFTTEENWPARPGATKATRAFEILLKKIAVMHKLQCNVFMQFYKLFLSINRENRTAIWDYYNIHYFLDNNLYPATNQHVAPNQYYRSPFRYVFLTANVLELKIYLKHQLNHGARPSLDDVSQFLDRQRTYYLKLALTVSAEENEIHNRRRDLYHYDPNDGVVKDGFSDELRSFYRESIVIPYGLIKQNGCPFARTKGIHKNSLLEVLEYFDNMILHLLANTREFGALFPQRSDTPHGAVSRATPNTLAQRDSGPGTIR